MNLRRVLSYHIILIDKVFLRKLISMLKKINTLVLVSLMVSACSNPSVTPTEPDHSSTGGVPLPPGTVLIDPNNPENPPHITSPAPVVSNVSSSSSSTSSASTHTVQQGETLFSLAKRYRVSVQELMSWNHLSSPSALKVGQKLRIHSTGGSRVASIPKYSSKKSVKSISYHTVKRGDTLYNVAKRYRQSVGNIAKWNGLRKSARLKVGQRLRVHS